MYFLNLQYISLKLIKMELINIVQDNWLALHAKIDSISAIISVPSD